MAESGMYSNEERYDYTSKPNSNADVLRFINESDPNLAELYLEITDICISELGWDPALASRYVLDWAMDSYLGEEYSLHFMDYYE